MTVWASLGVDMNTTPHKKLKSSGENRFDKVMLWNGNNEIIKKYLVLLTRLFNSDHKKERKLIWCIKLKMQDKMIATCDL